MRTEAANHAVPLKQWRLRHFKSVLEDTVDFSPLTVLMGPNSSGKSSLLQSILLMSQAALSNEAGETFSLNGGYVSLGGFKDVVSALARKSGGFEIGGTLALDQRAGGAESRDSHVVEWDLLFHGTPEHEPGSTMLQKVALIIKGPLDSLRLNMRRALQNDLQRNFAKSSIPTRNMIGVFLPPGYGSSHFKGKLKVAGLGEMEGYGLILRGAMPMGVLVKTDFHTLVAREWVTSARRDPRPGQKTELEENQSALEEIVDAAIPELERVLQNWRQDTSLPLPRLLQQSPTLRSLEREHKLFFRQPAQLLVERIIEKWGAGEDTLREEMPRLLSRTMFETIGFLSFSISYLGPLRKAPQVVYSAVQVPRWSFIGTDGEFTAAAVHAQKNRIIVNPSRKGSPHKCKLSEALSEWLDYLGLAKAIETESRGRLGIEMRVTDRELSKGIDLTNVGVGVSQLVPVVVRCLLSEPGSLVLLEQPELHLHPAVQQRLADFLLACARSGRQLLVETHSEYLVTRLRRRIAEDELDETQQFIGFVFAERDEQGRTHYRSIKPNRFGGLEPETPRGFFDETPKESEELLRAAIAKKQKSAQQVRF